MNRCPVHGLELYEDVTYDIPALVCPRCEAAKRRRDRSEDDE